MAISQYSSPVQNTLEQYVPIPLDMMMRAGQATQQRYDQAQDLDTSTQSGLASIEARAPGYQQYVQNTVGNYKNDMSSLIDKYNGRIDDPLFQREQKQIINKYKNDPNWNIIKNSNEAIKTDQDISAKLRAEGKLVINPSLGFSGLDNKGNLQSYQQGVKEVNTLDDWEKGLAIAHGSMQFDGRGFNTNAKSLLSARQAILNDINNNGPQTRDLITAYTQQGLTPDQAKQAIIGNVGTLVNKYGLVKTRDEGYYSNQLQAASIAQQAKFHNDEVEQRREAAELRAKTALQVQQLKNQGKGANGQSLADTPYAVPSNNAPINTGSNSNLRGFVADQSSEDINSPIKTPTKIEGKFFKIDPNQDNKDNGIRRTGGFNINRGTVQGVKNLWVTEQGNLVQGGHDYQVTQKVDPQTGKVDNYIGGQKVYKQTVVQYQEQNSDNNATKDKPISNPVTYYKLADKDEAIRYMGPDAAFYEGKNANNQFNQVKLQQNPDGTVKAKTPINMPSIDKIQTLAPYLGVDPATLQKAIKQDLDNLNNKGIDKNKYEQLRQLLDDNTLDKIYHQKVIAPQSQYQNKNKTTGSIAPVQDTDVDNIINSIGE